MEKEEEEEEEEMDFQVEDSAAFELATPCARKGRHVVTRRDVKAGEEVIATSCFAAVPADSELGLRCQRCLRRLGASTEPYSEGVQCGCRHAVYCSDECMNKEREMHEDGGECSALQRLPSLGIEGGTMPIRLIIRVAAWRASGLTDGDSPFTYQHVSMLESHVADASPDEVEAVKAVAQAIRRIMTPLPLSPGQSRPTRTAEPLRTKELVSLFYAIQCNAHGVKEEQGQGQGVALAGLGLFPLASMLNHSCTPNSIHSFVVGEQAGRVPSVVFKATSNMAAREEICYSYIDLYETSARRQLLLQRAYFFTCSCRRCTQAEEVVNSVPPTATATATAVGLGAGVGAGAGSEEKSIGVHDAAIDGLQCHQKGCGGAMIPSAIGAIVWCYRCGVKCPKAEYEARLVTASKQAESGVTLGQAVLSRQPAPTAKELALAATALGRGIEQGSGKLHPQHRLIYLSLSLLLQVTDAQLSVPGLSSNGKVALLMSKLKHLNASIACLELCLGGNHPELADLYASAGKAFLSLGPSWEEGCPAEEVAALYYILPGGEERGKGQPASATPATNDASSPSGAVVAAPPPSPPPPPPAAAAFCLRKALEMFTICCRDSDPRLVELRGLESAL